MIILYNNYIMESNLKNIVFSQEEYEKTRFKFRMIKRSTYIKPEKGFQPNDDFFTK